MSYNPAFVADEPPLAGSSDTERQVNGGIKLTSFRVLPVASEQPSRTSGGHHKQHRSHAAIDATGAAKSSKRHHINHAKSSSTHHNGHSNGKRSKQANGKTLLNESTSNLLSSSSSPINGHSTLSLLDNSQPSNTHSTTIAQIPMYQQRQQQQQQQQNDSYPTSSSIISTETTTATALTSSTLNSSSSASSSASSSLSSTGLCSAVECRDMRYYVGMGKNRKVILHDINVTVPEGSIYGLLGPSGCGKTTMLRCVVGRIKPKAGFVRVFGYHPNESGSQIPGPAIGYMPQVSVL